MMDWNEQSEFSQSDQDRHGAQYWLGWERVVLVGACIVAAYLVTLINLTNSTLTLEKIAADLAIVATTFFVATSVLQVVHMIAVRRRRARLSKTSYLNSIKFWHWLEQADPELVKHADEVDENVLINRAFDLKKKLEVKWGASKQSV